MCVTSGINHLGLAVKDLDKTTAFFTDILSWKKLAHDTSYPRTTVSDGEAVLTLWQVDLNGQMRAFDRRENIGLHHLALEVASEDALNNLYHTVLSRKAADIEFAPEPLGGGPRKHFMCYEPGGIRIEFIWLGV